MYQKLRAKNYTVWPATRQSAAQRLLSGSLSAVMPYMVPHYRAKETANPVAFSTCRKVLYGCLDVATHEIDAAVLRMQCVLYQQQS